jgi:hypothetical protein
MKSSIFSATALVLLLSLSGCSASVIAAPATPTQTATDSAADQQSSSEEQQTLQRIVDSVRAQLPALLTAAAGVYSNITVDPSGSDTLVITYTFANPVDPDTTSAKIDAQASTIQQVSDTTIFPAMKSGGLTGAIQATYIYLNADGSQIWEKTFTPSQT